MIYTVHSCSIKSKYSSTWKRNKKLEKNLRERGLTFSSTLDWGTEVQYVHVQADNPREAYKKIKENRSDLERAYDITIKMRGTVIAKSRE